MEGNKWKGKKERKKNKVRMKSLYLQNSVMENDRKKKNPKF